jgi:hypothetical protein
MVWNWEIFDDNLIKVVSAPLSPQGVRQNARLSRGYGERDRVRVTPSSGVIGCRKTGVFDALWLPQREKGSPG